MKKFIKKSVKFFEKKDPMLVLLGIFSSAGILLTSKLIVRFINKFLFELSGQYLIVIFLVISVLVYYEAKETMGDYGFRFGYLLGIIVIILSIIKSFFGIETVFEF